MPSDARERWFARIVESGLSEKILGPNDVLDHVTPDLLAQHLPADVMGRILKASLNAGAMTPDRVLETATPEVLAAHIPHDVLWTCIARAAERAGVTTGKK